MKSTLYRMAGALPALVLALLLPLEVWATTYNSLTVDGAINADAQSCTLAPVVDNAADAGVGSLRQAIVDVCPGGTVAFSGDTSITLSSGQLDIDKRLTIDGGNHAVTISGNNVTRVFNVKASGVVTLSHLSIVSGKVDSSGGGIHNAGALTVQDCVLSDNVSAENGGGIFNGIGGVLTVQNSVLSANRAGAGGGGIGNRGALTLQGSTLSGNSARYGGGIFNSDGGQMTIYNSTLSGNAATGTSSDNGGGAIDQWASSGDVSATIINSTIVNNRPCTTASSPTITAPITLCRNMEPRLSHKGTTYPMPGMG